MRAELIVIGGKPAEYGKSGNLRRSGRRLQEPGSRFFCDAARSSALRDQVNELVRDFDRCRFGKRCPQYCWWRGSLCRNTSRLWPDGHCPSRGRVPFHLCASFKYHCFQGAEGECGERARSGWGHSGFGPGRSPFSIVQKGSGRGSHVFSAALTSGVTCAIMGLKN